MAIKNPDRLPSDIIAYYALGVMRHVRNYIINSLSDSDKEYYIEDVTIGTRNKSAIKIDVTADAICRDGLKKKFGNKILVCGEEYYKRYDLDLSRENRLVALIDMLDGTDLFKRGMFNWCSAMILFYPKKKRIVAAFVGIPFDGIYFSHEGDKKVYKKPFSEKYEGEDGVCKKPFSGKLHEVKYNPGANDLSKAGICFYGQKIGNFISVAKKRSFVKGISAINRKTKDRAGTRLYNLAGNPMMIKLIQGNMDVIFELKGQPAHDVAPGAYIAMKAGAVFKNLHGKQIDMIKSLNRPADPKNYLRYILTTNNRLFNQTKKLFS